MPVIIESCNMNRSGNRPTSWLRLLATSVALSVLAAPASLAHKTFLASQQHVWDAGATVDVVLTSALEFPNIEFGPTRDRIAFISVITGNTAVEGVEFEESETALTMSFGAARPGFSVVAVSTHLRAGQIGPDDTSAYLDEIGASAVVRGAFDDLPGSPPLDRSYTKHTKIFLCIETCETGLEAGLAPTGQALEFVATASGGRTFQLLHEGAPVAGHRVEILLGSGGHHELVTSENGEIALDESMEGVALLSAIWITVPARPDGVYHSDQATLTIDLAQHS